MRQFLERDSGRIWKEVSDDTIGSAWQGIRLSLGRLHLGSQIYMAAQFSVDIVHACNPAYHPKYALVVRCSCIAWSYNAKDCSGVKKEDLEAMVARTRTLLQSQVACIPMTDCHLESNFKKRSKSCHVFSTRAPRMKLDRPKRMLIMHRYQNTWGSSFWCGFWILLMRALSIRVCVCVLSGNACRWKRYCWICAQWQSREELALGTSLGWLWLIQFLAAAWSKAKPRVGRKFNASQDRRKPPRPAISGKNLISTRSQISLIFLARSIFMSRMMPQVTFHPSIKSPAVAQADRRQNHSWFAWSWDVYGYWRFVRCPVCSHTFFAVS